MPDEPPAKQRRDDNKVRLTDDLSQDVALAADKMGVKATQLVRVALREYIDNIDINSDSFRAKTDDELRIVSQVLAMMRDPHNLAEKTMVTYIQSLFDLRKKYSG